MWFGNCRTTRKVRKKNKVRFSNGLRWSEDYLLKKIITSQRDVRQIGRAIPN